MRLVHILLLIIILNALDISARDHYADIWYFGCKAGINFTRGYPALLPPCKVDTREGVATIADKDGEILMYTDGTTIWDGYNHSVITNGVDLMGNWSCAQSAIIIPRPESDSIFYVFTSDCYGNNKGLRYNLVDMSIKNDLVNGMVTEKNILLHAPTTEHLTAVHHANGTDIWVIVHECGSDAFYAYLVTKDGISSAPVISNIGLSYKNDETYTPGIMKVSPDGNRLALTLGVFIQIIEIFDFDNVNGTISNCKSLFYSEGVDYGFYGVEFSPDCSKLYISCLRTDPLSIWQFDLNIDDTEELIDSKEIIAIQSDSINEFLFGTGFLQLASDGKIYAASDGNKILDAIEKPNEKGTACMFKDSAVHLLDETFCSMGLPNFITSYLKPQCGDEGFEYIDFLYTGHLALRGQAEQQDSIIRLTDTDINSNSLMWHDKPVPADEGFEVEFRFRMSDPLNDYDDGSAPGADGIAFIMSTESTLYMGSSGGGLGYDGIKNCLAFEFDTYKNGINPYYDPNGNHAAIFYIGQNGATTGHGSDNELAVNTGIIEILADSSIYYAKIDYNIEPGALRAFLDKTGDFEGSSKIIEIESFDINDYLDLIDGSGAYVGISSATGTSYEKHDVLYWSYCPKYIEKPVKVEEKTACEVKTSLKCYPNPVSKTDLLYINYNVAKQSEICIKIYNYMGEEMATALSKYENDGSHTFSYDTGNLPKGSYVIRMTVNGNVAGCGSFVVL